MSANEESWNDLLNTSQFFHLSIEPGQSFPISAKNLRLFCQALPALPFLLFGHPRMARTKVQFCRWTGFPCLHLHQPGVTERVFLDLLKILADDTYIPPLSTDPRRQEVLTDTVLFLGGTSEAAFLKTVNAAPPPENPSADPHGHYEWHVYQTRRDEVDNNSFFAEMNKTGFQLATLPQRVSYGEYLYFRRLKQQEERQFD